MTQSERWKDIPSDEDYYQVSDLGRVRSKTRYVRHNCGGLKKVEGQILSQVSLPNGYRQVSMYRNGKRKVMLVHRLVMMSFVGECPEGMEVRHLNSNRADNRLSNLAYGTHSENTIDTVKLGRNGRQKLKPEEVLEIREELSNGAMVKDLAAKYGVCRRTIGAIKSRKIYSWVEVTK